MPSNRSVATVARCRSCDHLGWPFVRGMPCDRVDHGRSGLWAPGESREGRTAWVEMCRLFPAFGSRCLDRPQHLAQRVFLFGLGRGDRRFCCDPLLGCKPALFFFLGFNLNDIFPCPPSHGPISTRTRGNTSRLTMMGLADTAAAAIGLPVDQFLYLSCMLAAYPLGFAFALIPFRYRSARHALAGSLGLAFAVVTLVCRRRGLGVGLVGSFAPLLGEVDRSFRNAESRRSSHPVPRSRLAGHVGLDSLGGDCCGCLRAASGAAAVIVAHSRLCVADGLPLRIAHLPHVDRSYGICHSPFVCFLFSPF